MKRKHKRLKNKKSKRKGGAISKRTLLALGITAAAAAAAAKAVGPYFPPLGRVNARQGRLTSEDREVKSETKGLPIVKLETPMSGNTQSAKEILSQVPFVPQDVHLEASEPIEARLERNFQIIEQLKQNLKNELQSAKEIVSQVPFVPQDVQLEASEAPTNLEPIEVRLERNSQIIEQLTQNLKHEYEFLDEKYSLDK